MNGLCLVAGLLLAPVGEAVTLGWQHSIQKIRWEEDFYWRDGQLYLASARVRGTGAGMEPPPDAVFREGAWHYQPSLNTFASVSLRHSPYVAPYELCVGGQCRPFQDYLPGLGEEGVVELKPCPPDLVR